MDFHAESASDSASCGQAADFTGTSEMVDELEGSGAPGRPKELAESLKSKGLQPLRPCAG